MKARAKTPAGHREKSLRSIASQSSMLTLVSVASSWRLMRRLSRSFLRLGPKSSRLMGINRRSKSRALPESGVFLGRPSAVPPGEFRFCNRAPELSSARAAYTGRVRTRCLSFHAVYRCHHSGECCRAGWDVEVEPHIVEAVRTGRVLPVVVTPVPFEPLNEGNALAPARTSTGDCGFHHDNRCSLHESGSASMLPSACRHFPRVFLRDARGDLLTLSHFCPTAASLLFEPGIVGIVDVPPALALEEPIEGLDARDALPPLVRPGLLADIEGYEAWERAAIETFIRASNSEDALATIEAASERVRRWTPSAGPLAHAVREAYSQPAPHVDDATPLGNAFSIVRDLTGPHPLMDVPATFQADWKRLSHTAADVMGQPLARYMAASTFGNWIAYRGEGLRSVVEWLRACHDVLRVQLVRHLREIERRIEPADLVKPIRMADYIMVHTVDSLAFGRAAAALER